MTSNEQNLAVFQTRVRQMILRFQQLKKENEELYEMVDRNEKDISVLRCIFFRYKAIVLAVRGRRTDSTRPLNRWYNGLALTSQF